MIINISTCPKKSEILSSSSDSDSVSLLDSSDSQSQCDDDDEDEVDDDGGASRYEGIVLIMLSAMFLSLGNYSGVLLQDEYGMDSFTACMYRSSGLLWPSLVLFYFYEWGCLKGKGEESLITPLCSGWKTLLVLIGRGACSSLALIFRYLAFTKLVFGDSSVIAYSTPILVTVLAHFLLGERAGILPFCLTFTTVLGVGIMTKPPMLTGEEGFDRDTLIGVGYAVASMVFAAGSVILTRVAKKVHFTLMLIVFGLVGILQGFILSMTLGTEKKFPTGVVDSLLILASAILAFLGQACYVLAMKVEKAGPIALVRSCSDVLMAYGIQTMVTRELPDLLSGIGGSIVFSGIVIMGLRKWLQTYPYPHGSKAKKFLRLWC